MRRLLTALLASLVLLAGCSDDEPSVGPTATGSGVGGSASTGGAGGAAGGAGLAGGQGGTGGGGAAAARGQIIVDPDDPAYLAYQDGSSYFLCGPGDPEGFLYRGTRNADGSRDGDQLALIAKLAPTGANGIYLQAVRSHGGDGGATENPFVDSDPTLGLDQDILSQWETWFSAMDDAGITVYLFLYDDSASVWSTGDVVGAEEAAFVAGLVDAFEHHDHLIWAVAEEYSESLTTARAAAIAAAIRGADDRDHVIAVHQLHGLTFDFPTDPNVDQFAIQYNVATAGELHAGMLTAFASAAGRYNLNMAEAAAFGEGAAARHKLWATAMGGAYVMVLGQDIASTAVSDLEDCGRLRHFLEAADLSGMAPHDELARDGTDYVLALPGERYLAYATLLGGAMGLAGLPAGSWQLDWLDTATGASVSETVSAPGGDVALTKPTSLGDEIALYVH